MGDHSSSSGGTERVDQFVTVAFVGLGALLLIAATYSTVVGWDDLRLAMAGAEARPGSRLIMRELNRELLAAFVGSVLFASGVLRWRE